MLLEPYDSGLITIPGCMPCWKPGTPIALAKLERPPQMRPPIPAATGRAAAVAPCSTLVNS
jgi:hypothetical protein